MKQKKASKRLMLTLPLRLAEAVQVAAAQQEQYAAEYVRDLLRRELTRSGGAGAADDERGHTS